MIEERRGQEDCFDDGLTYALRFGASSLKKDMYDPEVKAFVGYLAFGTTFAAFTNQYVTLSWLLAFVAKVGVLRRPVVLLLGVCAYMRARVCVGGSPRINGGPLRTSNLTHVHIGRKIAIPAIAGVCW